MQNRNAVILTAHVAESGVTTSLSLKTCKQTKILSVFQTLCRQDDGVPGLLIAHVITAKRFGKAIFLNSICCFLPREILSHRLFLKYRRRRLSKL